MVSISLNCREGETTPLADMRDDIVEALAKEAADEEFYSKESKLNDVLFEFGDDIEKFAESRSEVMFFAFCPSVIFRLSDFPLIDLSFDSNFRSSTLSFLEKTASTDQYSSA